MSQTISLADIARPIDAESEMDARVLSSLPSPGHVKFSSMRTRQISKPRTERTSTLNNRCANENDKETAKSSSENFTRFLGHAKVAPSSYRATSLQSRTSAAQGTEIDKIRKATQLVARDRDHHSEMFGDLLESTLLHEQLGKFDGQVGIGRYAHTCGRIEGSLIFDRLDTFDEGHDALMAFRQSAETRERDMIETREACCKVVGPSQLSFSMITQTDKAAKATESYTQHVINGPWSTEISGFMFEDMATTARSVPHDQGGHDHDDSPLDADVPSLNTVSASRRNRLPDASRSPDAEYQYSNGPPSHFSARSTVFTAMTEQHFHGEKKSRPTFRPSERMACTALRGASVESEAAPALTILERQEPSLPHVPVRKKPGRRLDHDGPGNACSGYTRRSDATTGVWAPCTTYGALQPTVQSLLPPLGPTIANPHRVVISTSAVKECSKEDANQRQDANGSEPQVANSSMSGTKTLRFSKSEDVRTDEGYEVANGLGQQVPTVQGLKGPFFTASVGVIVQEISETDANFGPTPFLESNCGKSYNIALR